MSATQGRMRVCMRMVQTGIMVCPHLGRQILLGGVVALLMARQLWLGRRDVRETRTRLVGHLTTSQHIREQWQRMAIISKIRDVSIIVGGFRRFTCTR